MIADVPGAVGGDECAVFAVQWLPRRNNTGLVKSFGRMEQLSSQLDVIALARPDETLFDVGDAREIEIELNRSAILRPIVVSNCFVHGKMEAPDTQTIPNQPNGPRPASAHKYRGATIEDLDPYVHTSLAHSTFTRSLVDPSKVLPLCQLHLQISSPPPSSLRGKKITYVLPYLPSQESDRDANQH